MVESKFNAGELLRRGDAPGGVFRLVPFYVGFLATGIGVSLPGVILPVLLTRWGLGDRGGGLLFFLAWLACSLGALLLSGPLVRALSVGSLLVALGSLGLAFCPAGLANACISLYGLGLGMTMTGISLLVQRQTADNGSVLVRLNLFWALGASVCPVIALHTLRTGKIGTLLESVAWVFLLLAAWTAFVAFRQRGISEERRGSRSLWTLTSIQQFLRLTPFRLVVLVMLTTGVEASAGAWLTTYAKRGGDPFSQIVAAPTCMWTGLLLSRLFWSLVPHERAEHWVVQGSLFLMSGSTIVLLVSRHGMPFFLAAACLGVGVGPVYPLLLTRALRMYSSGIIFFLAGVGSACLPWLTGLVASKCGSLHSGLFVPAAASVVMLALSLTGTAAEQKLKLLA